jgi:tetratricopeptide (TPR) repeat protein
MLMDLLRDVLAGRKSKRLMADARRLFDAGELDGAESACARLAEISPPLADAHYLRGLIALRREQVDPAIQHLEAAVEVRESEPSFHLTLADVFETLGKHERTALHLTRALKHLPATDPRRKSLMLRLALELEACDQLAEAEEWYRNVLQTDPYDGDALLRLAMRRLRSRTPSRRAS